MATTPHTPTTASYASETPGLTRAGAADDYRTVMLNRISWGAILAGVVTALVTQILLNLLGIGIGLSTIDPASGGSPQASTFSIAAAVWWTVSGLIASFGGGYVAGRLAGPPKASTAGWHGFTAWAATTLLIFYLLTSSIGSLVGGAFNTLGSAVGGLGRTAATAATAAVPALANVNDPFAAIERQVRDAAGGTDPQALRDAAVTAIRAVLTGDQAQAQAARDRAAEALARAANISPEEARNRIAQYEQQYRQAAQQARQAADQAASAVSQAAIFGFIALALGAVAGWFGGRMGHPRNAALA